LFRIQSLDLFDILARKLGRTLSDLHLKTMLTILLNKTSINLQIELLHIYFLRMVRLRFTSIFFTEYLNYLRNTILSTTILSNISIETIYEFIIIDLDLKSNLDCELLVFDIILPMIGRIGKVGSDIIIKLLIKIGK
jgi:hypothetical protein